MKLMRVKVLFIICISFLGRQSTHFGLMALEAGSLKPRCQEDQAPSKRLEGRILSCLSALLVIPVVVAEQLQSPPCLCMVLSPCVSVSFHGHPLIRTPGTGLKTRSAPVWPHTGLTLQLLWSYFQIQSHPGVLGVRTSTPAVFVFCIWGEDSSYCILEGIQSDL